MPENERVLRVLLIEDEYLVALLLGDMLTDLGHQVIGPIAQLGQALTAAREQDVDLGILDVNLGEGNSFAVASALRDRGVPIVFSTGYDSSPFIDDFPEAMTLQKPFQQIDLEKMIDEVRRRADARATQVRD
jgi:DNA-binding response OmpR family regulator